MRLINGKPAGFLQWIGVLVFIVFLMMLIGPHGMDSRAILEAKRASAQNNLGQIAKAYLTYSTSNSPPALNIQPGDTAHELAYILALEAGINDAAVWFVKSDERLTGLTIPKVVYLGDPRIAPINPAFSKLPLSVEIVAALPNGRPTSTPIAWTRGLQSDGTWPADSPWQGDGGHIAYLDGHVEWATKFSSYKYGTNIPTTNIREALPPGTVILSAEPKR